MFAASMPTPPVEYATSTVPAQDASGEVASRALAMGNLQASPVLTQCQLNRMLFVHEVISGSRKLNAQALQTSQE